MSMHAERLAGKWQDGWLLVCPFSRRERIRRHRQARLGEQSREGERTPSQRAGRGSLHPCLTEHCGLDSELWELNSLQWSHRGALILVGLCRLSLSFSRSGSLLSGRGSSCGRSLESRPVSTESAKFLLHLLRETTEEVSLLKRHKKSQGVLLRSLLRETSDRRFTIDERLIISARMHRKAVPPVEWLSTPPGHSSQA